MPAGSHAAPRGKDSLSRVNKTLSSARSSFRSQVHLGVLVAWVGLLLFGTVVIWTASLSIADASFSRHLLGIGIGVVLAFLTWRFVDFSNLQNLSTVLLVIDIVLVFLPNVPGLQYSAMGMTGWIRSPSSS